MTYPDNRLELYITGNADEVTAAAAERELTGGGALLDSFISVCQASLLEPPEGLTASVLLTIERQRKADREEMLFRRRIGAAACFLGAAVMAACTLPGISGHVAAFALSSQELFTRLAEVIKMVS